ncbi:catalase family peroxidase [Sporosarcina sp. YIM B06819]|uniref:catalase family peroxidase n=1 Tax=Sporosarcina sp. YIM B06819 TaxID=3081769 RepID=UPI00298C3C25|nr:catalase family peroxidase [Sporosarcina sp. YIM B06819]
MSNVPNRCPLTAVEAIDTIEKLAGLFPAYRRAHAKGIGFDAKFSPNGCAAPYTTASHLLHQDTSAIVRFSHSTSNPNPTEQLVSVKGMAVQFQLPEGKVTNLTMVTIPVFITKTPEEFIQLLQLFTSDKRLFSQKLSTLKNNPNFHAAFTILKNIIPPKSFGTGHYYSIHAYYLINDQKQQQAVKFEWEPIVESKNQTENTSLFTNRNALEDDLLNRLKDGPVRFKLLIQLAQPGDSIDDSTQKWPDTREKICIGTLSILGRRADNAESQVFDPTIVPDGILCSDDPVLHFRAKAYAESAKRRQNSL